MNENIFYISKKDEFLCINVINDKIIRFHFSKNKEFKHNYSFSIEKDIIPINFHFKEDKDEIFIFTSVLKIFIDKELGKIIIYDKDKIILSDYKDLGYKRMEKGVYCYKEIRDEIAFLGFGERTGSLNKKGERIINWNTDNPHHSMNEEPLYQSHPFFLAVSPNKSYGIFLDNTFRSYFDMGKESKKYYYFYAEDGELDYYFIYGPTPKEVIEGYTELTGRYYLPPIWALGYQQSRWSYLNEKEIRDIAKTFREKRIPCDVIYLDIDYMEGYKVFTIDEEKFSNFKKMVEELKEDGFKVITILDPGVKRDINYEIYKEGIERDYFCKKSDGKVYIGYVWPGECVFPDFVKEEVREWWGEKQQNLIDKGVSGIWNDMNEPSVMSFFDYKMMRFLFYHLKFKEPPKIPNIFKKKDFYKNTLPSNIIHGKNNLSHDEIHNVYGLLMAKASFEGWKKKNPNIRPLILTRAGFSGIQKYSAVWTGDNKSCWEHLYMSIIMLQNLGISGIPFVGCDIGGFWRDCEPELFIRWIEVGTFYPFFRNHSAKNTKKQEPWKFNKDVEDIARKYINLRYQLIPYIYSLFYEAKEKGIPILRSLILEFPDDPKVIEFEDEFMFGPCFLIAPIYEKGKIERKVYLPRGKWYNFWNNEIFEGPKIIKVKAQLDTIPIFVREGSIIPMWEVKNYIGEKIDKIYLKIYPGDGEFLYYEDDGISWDYERGEYNLIKFSLYNNKLNKEYIHNGYKGVDNFCLL